MGAYMEIRVMVNIRKHNKWQKLIFLLLMAIVSLAVFASDPEIEDEIEKEIQKEAKKEAKKNADQEEEKVSDAVEVENVKEVKKEKVSDTAKVEKIEKVKKEKGFRYEIDNNIAKVLVTKYYNRNGLWSGHYKIKAIKRIRLQHFNKRRAVAHVEYIYANFEENKKASNGVDKRTFTLIKHERWNVISMGKHMSAKF